MAHVHGADKGISSKGARIESKNSHKPHSLIICTILKAEVGLRWVVVRKQWQKLSN